MTPRYQLLVGERLRHVRHQQDMTLQDVEERSNGRWKAVVVGAYERGDRAISAVKLAGLADFYSVPVSALLPEPEGAARAGWQQDQEAADRVVIDLSRLESQDRPQGGDPALQALSRFVHTIQQVRGDYNGRMLTLRQSDLQTLAVFNGLTGDEFAQELKARGVLLAS